MENAAQSPKPDARIIRLRTPKSPIKPIPREEYHILDADLYTLLVIDELLDEHFK